jgi:hypothetical protein
MRTRSTTALALTLAAAWLGSPPPPLAAQARTPADLKPCAFGLDEISQAFGIGLRRTDPADMTIPVGRDVGCLYSVKGSDFVFGVRQTWDSTRPGSAPSPGAAPGPGYRQVVGDPDGAVYLTDAGGSSGELVYVRGKVQTRVFWHGGNLSNAEGMQRLLALRRVP